MIVNKTFQYRLNPTQDQEQQLHKFAGATRFVYNWGLDQYKKALEANCIIKPNQAIIKPNDDTPRNDIKPTQLTDDVAQLTKDISDKPPLKKLPTCYDLCYQLPILKKQEATSWLKGAPSQALQGALNDLQLSMKAFFRERKRNPLYGFPRFKARGKRDSFRVPQGFKWEHKAIFIPKIGWLKYWDRYNRLVEGLIKQVTVKYDGVHWYVMIVSEIILRTSATAGQVELSQLHEIEKPHTESPQPTTTISQEVIGKDRFVIKANPEESIERIKVPQFLDPELDTYKKLSRRMSRCTKDSKRWRKAVQRLTKFHIKIKNRRKDFLHKLTSDIVAKSASIEVHRENIKKKIQGNRWHQNRLLHDLAWGNLEAYLKYKALWNNKNISIVEK